MYDKGISCFKILAFMVVIFCTSTSYCYADETIFEVGSCKMISPVADMEIMTLLERSIGYLPKDAIRDGLPHFGAIRDDWKGKTRKHKGVDIYGNHMVVLSTSYGRVIKVGRGRLSGLYVKIDHGNQIYTVYIHLTSSVVKQGQRVQKGQVIGFIDCPSGNAIEPQLHFELQIGAEKVDPILFIEKYFQSNHQNEKVIKFIRDSRKSLPAKIKHRQRLVTEYLSEKRRRGNE